jgi:hypothetical protein
MHVTGDLVFRDGNGKWKRTPVEKLFPPAGAAVLKVKTNAKEWRFDLRERREADTPLKALGVVFDELPKTRPRRTREHGKPVSPSA